jgi:hypothetical protein
VFGAYLANQGSIYVIAILTFCTVSGTYTLLTILDIILTLFARIQTNHYIVSCYAAGTIQIVGHQALIAWLLARLATIVRVSIPIAVPGFALCTVRII